MRSRSALIVGLQQLLGREHADPRVAQLLFLVPVAVDVFFVLGLEHEGFATSYALGLGLVVVATTVAYYVGKGELPERWTVSVPVLDIIALGSMRITLDSAVGIALVFPAIWLGLQFGRKGVLLTIASVTVCIAMPLAVGNLEHTQLARTVLVLLTATLCSIVVATTAEMWQNKVTEAAEAQRMLERAVADSAEQRRFNEAILRSVDVGLLTLDGEGRVHTMNPRQQRFMELAYPEGHDGSPDQKGHLYAADGFTELGRDELPTWLAVHGESVRDYVIWVGEDPATRRAAAVSISPFLTPGGRFDGAVLAYHDITELMNAARLKEEFVATVSHELRTPLTSIVGYVDLLLEDVDAIPEQARPFLLTVQRNARRLHRLVDDLLSDALKLGKAEIHLGRISMAQVLRTSAIEAEKAARAKGLEFSCDVGRSVLEVSGDAERLAQVIDNIFSNAIKFTPPGGRVTGVLVREGREAVVRISDTGRGIPPDELEDVFVTFFRSPGVQMDAIPGTGLGLAISKTIVEAHGGRIGVTSELGKGTTMEVRIPLAGPRVAHTA